MKKINFFGVVFIIFLMVGCCLAADEAVTTPSKPLTIEELIGTDDAYLEPTMFPYFYDDDSDDNPTCADYLNEQIDGEWRGKDRWTSTSVVAGEKWAKNLYPYNCSGCVDDGESNYSNCAQTIRTCDGGGNCPNVYFPCKENGYTTSGLPQPSTVSLVKGEYQLIPGLEGTTGSAKGYRNITKISFTWTVRVEGSGRLVAVWPFICHPHHGTSYQEFIEGPLKTQLYVKSDAPGNGVKQVADDGTVSYVSGEFVPVGQIAEMTVPSAGKGSVTNIGDPTITGGYVLIPSDFANGRIPNDVYFEIRWYNETSMRIRSPKNQRNLIVSVFPVTNQDE
ncbi:MAG: hypothetical protein AABZ65_02715 [Candidatus Omnitrophota bacterium]